MRRLRRRWWRWLQRGLQREILVGSVVFRQSDGACPARFRGRPLGGD